MGFKKDDPSAIPKSSFRNCVVVFLPVSIFWGTVHSGLFFLERVTGIETEKQKRQKPCIY
jgi:hypothetical protein